MTRAKHPHFGYLPAPAANPAGPHRMQEVNLGRLRGNFTLEFAARPTPGHTNRRHSGFQTVARIGIPILGPRVADGTPRVSIHEP